MSKTFAIFIPILTIIITTVFIVFSQNRVGESEGTSKNAYLLLLGIGIMLFISVFYFIK